MALSSGTRVGPYEIVSALGSPYDATADGKRFLVSTTSEQAASEPLTLVINWTAQLKR